MKVLVPGISGFVGKAIQRLLLEAGHEVIGLVHSGHGPASADSRVTTIEGDVTKPASLVDVPQFDACIYLPGLIREFPSKGITFEAVHAQGVANLIRIAKERGATRWVQMSALGVGRGYETGYYSTKLTGEEYVKASGLDWTIFRPSVVFSDTYDPRPNFVSELASVIKQLPVIPVFGDGQYRLQPISLNVLAKAMVDSLTMPHTIGEIYEAGGPEKLTYREILRTIAQGQGLERKRMISLPFAPFRFLASLLDRYPFFPITQGQLTMLEKGNTVDDPSLAQKFEMTFSPAPEYFAPAVARYFADRP